MSDPQLTLETYRDSVIEASRSSGERRALSAVDGDDWSNAAWQVLVELARSGRTFSADDVMCEVGPAPSDGACGALFRAGAASKLIVAVGVTTSTRVRRHAGLQR